MAFESELGNFITIGNAVSAEASAALVNAAQGLALVHAEAFPDNTNVIKFRKSGSLVAEAIAESAAYTYSANSELTDASISCTGTKKMVSSRVSVEALRFGSPGSDLQRIGQEQGNALARLFDADLKALFASVSGGVTAASTLVKDNLLDAQYTVFAGIKGAFSGRLVGMVDYKGAGEIRKELTSITATAFGNLAMLGVIGVPKGPAGFIGEFAGIELYQTDGLPSSGGDDVALVWDPRIAFCAGINGIQGLATTVLEPSVLTNMCWEFTTHTFWNVAEWNDAAGCKVLSDT